MYLLIPNGGMSLVTFVGDLEGLMTLLCGIQDSNSNSLEDLKEIWDRGQEYLMDKGICASYWL